MVSGLAHFSTIYRIIWDLTAEKTWISKKAPLKLKVIHLLRRLERIERDLEELDGMLAGLPMDREYSLRLRDSLIEESSRLKDFKQKILTQRVISDSQNGLPSPSLQDSHSAGSDAQSASDATEVSIDLPGSGNGKSGRSRPVKKENGKKATSPRVEKREPESKSGGAPGKESGAGQKEEKPSFEFRFE
ncbi:MAG: hypothetical protein CMN76_14180 [Spirochaetaceae bacterium]|nr:hypothetical protein [Spirochaetaceae bacterium]|tara:strand:+ start:185585 stop:186151 length:567 start_codon:yes stop_codon:yes gene_type:complete